MGVICSQNLIFSILLENNGAMTKVLLTIQCTLNLHFINNFSIILSHPGEILRLVPGAVFTGPVLAQHAGQPAPPHQLPPVIHGECGFGWKLPGSDLRRKGKPGPDALFKRTWIRIWHDPDVIQWSVLLKKVLFQKFLIWMFRLKPGTNPSV